MRLVSLHRYPVKSCRGERLTSALVEPWGLAGDRRWMIVDDDGVLITAREHPRLLLVTPTRLNDGGLSFTSPDLPELRVPPPTAGHTPATVWQSTVDAVLADNTASAWLSKIIGTSARLVFLDDPTQRPTKPTYTRPDDRVSFADGFPLLLTTTGSLEALNDAVAAGRFPAEGPLPMTRFRPNVVVDGAEAWAEDGWRRVRIGKAEFRAVSGCARCVMTTVDPITAAKGKEPIASLARLRRWDGKTWFGMNLVPDSPGVTIDAGDEVEVLEAVAAPDGPPR